MCVEGMREVQTESVHVSKSPHARTRTQTQTDQIEEAIKRAATVLH